MFHKLTHWFRQDLWEVLAHLPVPGYTRLVRQRCTVCGDTRVQELPGPPRSSGADTPREG